jgi:hypothetical protein
LQNSLKDGVFRQFDGLGFRRAGDVLWAMHLHRRGLHIENREFSMIDVGCPLAEIERDIQAHRSRLYAKG